MVLLRRKGDDVEIFEALKQKAIALKKELPEFVKEIIDREIKRNDNR